jgi:excisionase family DNA binding protein
MHPDGVSITKAPLLTRHEAAEALHQSLRTIDENIANGSLRVVRIGRSVRIRPEALEEFIDARETRSNPRKKGAK